jgi:chromosome segregation ATPase
MASNGNQPFLDLEEQASRLVDELDALRSETESYAAADRDLRNASRSISELTDELRRVATEVGSSAQAMRSIGTAELLAGLKSVTSRTELLQADLARLSTDLQTHVQTLQHRSDDFASGHAAAIASVDVSVTALKQQIDQTAGSMERRISTLEDQVLNAVHSFDSRLQESAAATATRIAQLRTTQSVGLAVIIALLIVIVVLVV